MRRWAIGMTIRGSRGPSRAPTRSSNRSSGDKNPGSCASATSVASWHAATAGSSGRITRSTNRMENTVAAVSVTTPANRDGVRSGRAAAPPAASSQRTTRSTASSTSRGPLN